MSIFYLQSSIVNRQSERGSTLIEALFAILIISIGLLTLAGMQVTSLRGNVSSRDMTIAISLAEEMIERIRVNGGDNPGVYDNLDTGSCTGLTNTTAREDCNTWKERLKDPNLGLKDARGTVAVRPNSPINNTATVTVTVEWDDIIRRKITFTTIVETWRT